MPRQHDSRDTRSACDTHLRGMTDGNLDRVAVVKGIQAEGTQVGLRHELLPDLQDKIGQSAPAVTRSQAEQQRTSNSGS